MTFSAKQLAEVLQGSVEGDSSVEINAYSKIEEGKPGTLAFLSNPKYEHYIYTTLASIVLVNNDFKATGEISATLIRVPNAYMALATLLQLSEQNKSPKVGINSLAFISPSAKIGKNVYIGAFAYIDDEVVIGDNCQIYPHCHIGEACQIGNNTILFPHVSVYHDCIVGKNCSIHASTVIGADGFGFAKDAEGNYIKMPQIGNVIIEDNVDIGASTTIDRGSIGPTVIKKGAIIDNQVQIGHNSEIGYNSAIAGCCGLAGSTKLGDNCIIAGMVGIAGHLSLADHTTVGASSSVTTSFTKNPGQVLQGAPAQPSAKYRRNMVVSRKLAEVYSTMNDLKKEIKALQEQINK